MKICPQCNSTDVPEMIKTCPFCGYNFKMKQEKKVVKTKPIDKFRNSEELLQNEHTNENSNLENKEINTDSLEIQTQKQVQNDKKNIWNSKYILLIVVLALIVAIGFSKKDINNNSSNEEEIAKNGSEQENSFAQEEEKQEENKEERNELVEDTKNSEVTITVEDEILEIREFYNKIVENIENGEYSEISLQDGSVIYYKDSKLRAIIVPKNVNGSSYRKSYYYSEDKLIFAYYEAQDAHRFYFNEEKLMRWRYSKNTLDAQNAVNYDFEKTDEYLDWEYTVLEESNILKNKINPVIKNSIKMNNITYASATSSFSEYNMTHLPERVFDGDISTAWVEGVEGQGIGETITLYFDKEYLLNTVVIYAGYQKNLEIYEKNSRPKEVKLSFSDGSSQVYMLTDIDTKQELILEKAVTTQYISFTIQSVYPGNKYEDTVISEIYLY